METIQAVESPFYTIADVCRILGVSKSKGYKIIRKLNEELAKGGFITLHGKVSKRYFNEKVCL